MRSWTRVGAVAVAVAGLLGVPAAAGWARTPAPVPSTGRPGVVAASAVAGLRAELRAGTVSRTHGVSRICAVHHLACQAEALTVAPGSQKLLVSGTPIGYGAPDLEKAYGLTGNAGTRGTIAIIDAGAYPTLESDLTIYRDAYGLPRCTSASGCFKQVSYKGGAPYTPSADPDTAFLEELVSLETALDVDMASAACPNCKILEVQVPALDAGPENQAAEDVATLHFATAAKTAASLGANSVSISYGYDTDTYTDTGAPATTIALRGVAVVASSGDSGVNALGNVWPSALTTVVSAGGTSLYTDPTNSRGFTETAWGSDSGDGAGSGCTYDLGPANHQPDSVSSACDGNRAASDISAVADPNTGVAVYNSYAPATGFPYGFVVVGGTSASAPFIAGMYARAGVKSGVLGPNEIYEAPASKFRDVVIGQTTPSGVCETYYGLDDRLCTAGPGWDGPTGVGTPKGLATFQ